MPSIARGTFQLESHNPPYRFTADLNDQAPLPTDDSYGGWVVTGIPKRVGVTEYSGRSPIGLAIDFLIDRFLEDDPRYVDSMRDNLERLCGIDQPNQQPPVVTLQSNGLIPYDATYAPKALWVIESLAWDREATINGDSGPVRVAGTITLRMFNVGDVLEGMKGPGTAHQERTRWATVVIAGYPVSVQVRDEPYIVKFGDTLRRIAASELGNGAKWREIADVNGKRDSRDVTVGEELRLPVGQGV